MKIIKLLLITALVITGLNAKEKEKRITISQLDDNLYKMKIYINYGDPYKTQLLMLAEESEFTTTLPFADKLDIVKITQVIKYKNSISMNPINSFIYLRTNQNYVEQSRLESLGSYETIQADIPLSFLTDNYNDISVHIMQQAKKDVQDYNKRVKKKKMVIGKSTKKINEGGVLEAPIIDSPEVWTQIDSKNSYIEMIFRLKPFKESLDSIYKFLFDNKMMVKDKINFVFPKQPKEDDLQNYTFMANIIGNILKFKDMDFSVSTEINNKLNNVIIANRKDLKTFFKDFKDTNNTLSKRLSGNINVIQNPSNIYKGILVITGNSQKELFNSIVRVGDEDIPLIKEQNIKFSVMDLPKKSEPFSAPKFLRFDKKYLFSELGFETNTLLGSVSWNLHTSFTIYPIYNYTHAINEIHYRLNYILADSRQLKPIFNLYINETFVSQRGGKDGESKTDFQSVQSSFSGKYLKNGKNNFGLEITNYPRDKKMQYKAVAALTFEDDSYLIFPKGVVEVEYPNLKYISEMAFPFSIYPDLQNTGILITDFNSNTIASAMHIAFQLGEKLDTPAYRLTTTYDINKVLDKDIIVLGNQIPAYKILYQNAPIKISGNSIIREHDIKRNGKIISVKTKTVQDISDYIIAQTYKSPFNDNRIVFEVLATNPKTLLKGVQDGLTPSNIGQFDGDVWLYNIETEKSKSFRFKEKYLVHNITSDSAINYLDDEYQDIEEF